MGDKATFNNRLQDLRLNVDALEEVKVHLPEGIKTIPNKEGKKGSLQVYAAITTNDGYIDVEGASRGLKVFGQELREESAADSKKHPNIRILEYIVANGSRLRVDVIRNYDAKPIPPALSVVIPEIVEEFGTPFHVYDETGIRETARELNQAFSWVPEVGGFGFRNYFAVKALPNPRVLEILVEEGMGTDCSSLPELMLANAVGLYGEKIMFTSNDTPPEEFRFADEVGAIINFDDLTHIDSFLDSGKKLPELTCFRYNPGKMKKGNSFIGDPTEAKYGLTREQLTQGFMELRGQGVRRFGLHTMVASNELNPEYFIDTARILFETVGELSKELGINFEFVNLGGGIGTPYKAEQNPVDISRVSEGIKDAYDNLIVNRGHHPLRVVMENGRMIAGPHGFLVSKVLHVAEKHKRFVGLDSCMADLMRPGLYGAYHELTILGKEDWVRDGVYDVTGSLCENNDKFAINRVLPEVSEGDIAVIHNTGAHGHAMGFNYNGKLKSPEFLFREDGSVEQIRREETATDYFKTLSGFPGSRFPKLCR